MSDVRHVYRCKRCGAVVEMYLNHVDAKTPWTPERGCGEGCQGTFRHPSNRCPSGRFRDVAHDAVRLEIVKVD